MRNGLRQVVCRVIGANVGTPFLLHNFNYRRKFSKTAPTRWSRAYPRVMRIRTIADEVTTPLSHLAPSAV